MAYTVPSFEELLTLAQERHRAEMPGTDAFLWPNTEFVLMRAVAGMVHMNFEYLNWIKNQRFAHLADGDELDNHGRPWGLTRKPATRAKGYILVVGTPSQTLLAGVLVQRSDGVQFTLLDDVTADTFGNGKVRVEAVDAGSAGNTDASAELALVDADDAFTSVKVDEIGLGTGADTENDESFRARVLFRLRNPPRGGSEADYVSWATSVPGVTRVWVENLAFGPGSVGLWFMTDGASPSGIPSAPAIESLQDYIDTVRPETARAIVLAPTAAMIDVRIGGIAPSETQQRYIEAELRNVFRRRVAPTMPKSVYTLRSSMLWSAVARITGDTTHRILVPEDVELPLNHIPALGSICYI